MDLTGDPAKRDKPNAFVELLWERGSLYEKEVIAGLTEPVVDLSGYSAAEKEQRTLDAMERGEPLIYSGRIQAGDLLGEPDLIRRDDAGYCAGDIKSGSGEEGPENDSKPKIHYAVQLGLYTDILERMGLSSGRRAFVWDIHGREVPYEFEVAYGKRGSRTLWDEYEDALGAAREIISGASATLPAYGASKAAVRQITQTVAQHCGRQGYRIRCNSIHPGIIDTELVAGAFSDEQLANLKRSIPSGEFGVPNDVAQAALFLASDEARYVTGTRLLVDGGATMQ